MTDHNPESSPTTSLQASETFVGVMGRPLNMQNSSDHAPNPLTTEMERRSTRPRETVEALEPSLRSPPTSSSRARAEDILRQEPPSLRGLDQVDSGATVRNFSAPGAASDRSPPPSTLYSSTSSDIARKPGQGMQRSLRSNSDHDRIATM